MKVAYPIACTHLRITSVLPGAGEGRVWIAQASGVVRRIDLAAALQGAIVKDEDKDSMVFKEYLENIMKKRGSQWLGLYKECKELNK